MRRVVPVNSDLAFLILRLVLGAVMLTHGFPKVTGFAGTAGFFASAGVPVPTLAAAYAAVVEVGGGVLILLGIAVDIVGLLFAVDMIGAIVFVAFKNGFRGGLGIRVHAALHRRGAGAGRPRRVLRRRPENWLRGVCPRRFAAVIFPARIPLPLRCGSGARKEFRLTAESTTRTRLRRSDDTTIHASTTVPDELDWRSVNSIRALAMDAVEAAQSGHPGTPMALAPAAYVLWHRFLRHNPRNPDWPDRDRFVLSCGHASMLLYALLYLTGYDLSLDDIKAFRQWGSKTPGHPERGHTPGVETTTGPLGQGVGKCGRDGDCGTAAVGAFQPPRAPYR